MKKQTSLILMGLLMILSQTISAPLSSRVQMHLGRPTLFINDQPCYPMIYALTDVPGGRWSWEEVPQRNIKLFSDAGVHLFQVDLFLEHLWFEDGRFDISLAQKQIRGVLEVCPEAAVIIRFHVNSPKWWIKRYPQENTVYADAAAQPDTPWGLLRIIEDDAATPMRTSLASKKWLAESGEMLKRFCRELAATPEGGALFALQLAGGIYGEWHYWGLLHNEPDMSEPMQEYFRLWLEKKYGSDRKLQQAWQDPTARLSIVQVPDLQERLNTQHGIFRDPQTEARIIEYYQCQHELVADDILYFCKIAKQNWPRPLVVGAFYGYYFSCFGREATGGHLALRKVLQSPDIDFLCGPNAYYPNTSAVGDPYRSRGLLESIRLHGKLWLDEMDQQPYLNSRRAPDYPQSVANSISHVRRNTLFTYTKGMGLWFYDFGAAGQRLNSTAAEFVTGWWDHPDLMQDIAAMKRFLDQAWQKPYRSAADVLMVFGTENYYHMAIKPELNPIGETVVNTTTLAAYQAGVVFDAIHVDDVSQVALQQYKVVVFVNTFILSESQRQWIRKNVLANGRHAMFIYAPGFGDGQRLDTKYMQQLTGISLASCALQQAPEIYVPAINLNWKTGEKPFKPSFCVNDAQAVSLGTYTENGSTALAKKQLKEATSWFVAMPPIDAALLRYLLQQCDVHFYAEPGDVFYACSNTVVLHSKTGGPKKITLKNGRIVSLELPPGGCTKILDAESGEVLF